MCLLLLTTTCVPIFSDFSLVREVTGPALRMQLQASFSINGFEHPDCAILV